MKFCILGGGGSFGLHTAKYLLDQPGTERVWSVGRGMPKLPCFTMGVGEGDKRYTYITLHTTYDVADVLHFLHANRPDVIINFAAQGESATSFHDSWRYFETNCMGLSRLIERLIGTDYLQRFIHIGSSEVYGATNRPALERAPLLATSPYAISKGAFDQYLLAVIAKYGFPGVILRPSNAYGEGQQLHRFIPKAMLYGLTGRKLPLHGGGKAEKSFIHSEDLARAIHIVATITQPIRPLYNIGPLDPTAMIDVARLVAHTLNMELDDLCEVAEDRDHQDSRYWLDSTLAGTDLGWQPQIGWNQGLARVRNWVAANLDQLRRQPTDFIMKP